MSDDEKTAAKEPINFELSRFLNVDAQEMILAREQSVGIHHGSDIRAAGNEVELRVRQSFSNRLPSMYYVGHGHIVDKHLIQSPQLDILVADNIGSRSLMKAKDGTEYLPFESIYAIGEVKSSFDITYVNAFASTKERILTQLRRNATRNSSGMLGNGLFTFMLFVNSGKFKMEDLQNAYAASNDSYLPNCICMLDRGIVTFISFLPDSLTDFQFIINPGDMYPPERKQAIAVQKTVKQSESVKDGWHLIPFGAGKSEPGANFAALYFMLLSHLMSSKLEPLPMFDYMKNILSHGELIRIT